MWKSLLPIVLLTAHPCFSSVLGDLDASELADLRAGQLVVRTENVDGAPWPRLVVYTAVDAPVSAVEKVFRDYASAPSYTPGLTSAEVLAQPDPNTYDVRYTSAMPLIGDSVSTVRNSYRQDGDNLVVRWKLLEATHADESTGELRVEPDGNGGSILRYTNFVRPKSSFAKLAKSAALGEVKKTVTAIKAESEKRQRAAGS
jgi:hypothetical protein